GGMEDKWFALKLAEGDRQTAYFRLDAISGIAPAGLGSRVWVHGAPVLVEEKPPQILQKMKAAKPLFGDSNSSKAPA
ncbi:MAG TPA: hypothetical protein VFR31_21715, partial [Thermoanaerobaculia bacterium]|nr:hypothetical protein [Thermoanaerobaculia bacterium]